MKISAFLQPPILLLLCALYALRAVIAADQFVSHLYSSSQLTNGYRCPDLQFNNTDECIITTNAIYIFGRLDKGGEADYPSLLIGKVDLKTAFKQDEYQIEWWTSPNLTGGINFLSGDDSRLTFNAVQLLPDGTGVDIDGLIGFHPASHTFDVVAWPSNAGGPPPNHGIGTNVAETNMSYYIGPQGLGLIDGQYPFSLFAYNYSDGSVARKTAPQKSWGTISYVHLGTNGTLIMIGGTEAVGTAPLAMDQVYIYSIATDSWFIQPTTGTTPSSRTWTCAVVVSAGDNSSHQIHVYGGARPEDIDAAPVPDNYYILSVPQFVWTRAPSVPHAYAQTRCVLLGTHRMLITGGLRQTYNCEALLRILDLNTGNVTMSFADQDAYAVPAYVAAHIGGGSHGGASMTRPVAGFVDGLEAALATPPAAPGEDHNGVAEPGQHGRRVPLAAIVAGTVGGVCLVALVVCGLIYWRRRNATHPQPEETGAPVAEVDGQQRCEAPVGPAQELPNMLHQPRDPVYELSSPASELLVKT